MTNIPLWVYNANGHSFEVTVKPMAVIEYYDLPISWPLDISSRNLDIFRGFLFEERNEIMTDNDVIKALEGKLPLGMSAIHGAIDLINRQKAEIKRLEHIKDTIAVIAIKEVADRYEGWLLSQLITAPLDKKEWINFCLDELDNLKKEMVGES